MSDELRALGARSFWSFGLDLDDFFDQVLGMAAFQVRAEPRRLEVGYDDV